MDDERKKHLVANYKWLIDSLFAKQPENVKVTYQRSSETLPSADPMTLAELQELRGLVIEKMYTELQLDAQKTWLNKPVLEISIEEAVRHDLEIINERFTHSEKEPSPERDIDLDLEM